MWPRKQKQCNKTDSITGVRCQSHHDPDLARQHYFEDENIKVIWEDREALVEVKEGWRQ